MPHLHLNAFLLWLIIFIFVREVIIEIEANFIGLTLKVNSIVQDI